MRVNWKERLKIPSFTLSLGLIASFLSSLLTQPKQTLSLSLGERLRPFSFTFLLLLCLHCQDWTQDETSNTSTTRFHNSISFSFSILYLFSSYSWSGTLSQDSSRMRVNELNYFACTYLFIHKVKKLRHWLDSLACKLHCLQFLFIYSQSVR